MLFTPLSALSGRFKLSQSECAEFIDVIVKDRLAHRKEGFFQQKSVAARLGLLKTPIEDAPTRRTRDVLSTGDGGLDALLNGGIRKGALSEIAGEASVASSSHILKNTLKLRQVQVKR